ncbi:MAG TPA: hypothetical protein VFG63_08835 [Nocardioidaceae bacterium]|nr:hypothetical protein [Nocardioidaceae bacterium]
MSMHDTTSAQGGAVRWAVPAVSVAFGLAYLVAGWVGDNLGFGVFGLLLMLLVAGGFVLASRHSETVAGLADRRDERINRLDAGASQFAGLILLLAVLVMFVVEVARGADGSPYFQLGALFGVCYLGALAFLRFRR